MASSNSSSLKGLPRSHAQSGGRGGLKEASEKNFYDYLHSNSSQLPPPPDTPPQYEGDSPLPHLLHYKMPNSLSPFLRNVVITEENLASSTTGATAGATPFSPYSRTTTPLEQKDFNLRSAAVKAPRLLAPRQPGSGCYSFNNVDYIQDVNPPHFSSSSSSRGKVTQLKEAAMQKITRVAAISHNDNSQQLSNRTLVQGTLSNRAPISSRTNKSQQCKRDDSSSESDSPRGECSSSSGDSFISSSLSSRSHRRQKKPKCAKAKGRHALSLQHREEILNLGSSVIKEVNVQKKLTETFLRSFTSTEHFRRLLVEKRYTTALAGLLQVFLEISRRPQQINHSHPVLAATSTSHHQYSHKDDPHHYNNKSIINIQDSYSVCQQKEKNYYLQQPYQSDVQKREAQQAQYTNAGLLQINGVINTTNGGKFKQQEGSSSEYSFEPTPNHTSFLLPNHCYSQFQSLSPDDTQRKINSNQFNQKHKQIQQFPSHQSQLQQQQPQGNSQGNSSRTNESQNRSKKMQSPYFHEEQQQFEDEYEKYYTPHQSAVNNKESKKPPQPPPPSSSSSSLSNRNRQGQESVHPTASAYYEQVRGGEGKQKNFQRQKKVGNHRLSSSSLPQTNVQNEGESFEEGSRFNTQESSVESEGGGGGGSIYIVASRKMEVDILPKTKRLNPAWNNAQTDRRTLVSEVSPAPPQQTQRSTHSETPKSLIGLMPCMRAKPTSPANTFTATASKDLQKIPNSSNEFARPKTVIESIQKTRPFEIGRGTKQSSTPSNLQALSKSTTAKHNPQTITTPRSSRTPVSLHIPSMDSP